MGSARVRALALYAHQVAVWDPLPRELYVLRAAADQGWEANTEPLRIALCQIAELSPLVADGIVVWLPDLDRAYSDAMGDLTETIDRTIDNLDLDGVALLEEPRPPPYGQAANPNYSPWDDVHFAVADVAADLVYSNSGEKVQPVFANELARRIAPHLVELPDFSGDQRTTRLHKIAALTQGLTVPTSREIVTVRRNSEGFNDWRLAVERILAAVELEDDVVSARQIVDGELALPREKLKQEVDRSHVLSATRHAGASLGWAILASPLVVAAGASPSAATVGVASSVGIEWVKHYVQRLRTAAGSRALLAHYLSFENVTNAAPAKRTSPTWTANRPSYRSPLSDSE